jgi:hypothetical protein
MATNLTAGPVRRASGQFAKGRSGNPAGRVGQPQEIRALLQEATAESIAAAMELVRQGNPEHVLRVFEALVRRLPEIQVGGSEAGPIRLSVAGEAMLQSIKRQLGEE